MEKQVKKRVTMKDVANEAGVTNAIVSRVINNDESLSVKQETREAVMTAVKKLKYVPNLSAKSLKTNRNYTIAVLIADVLNPFFAELLKGIQQAAEKTDYSIVVMDTDDRENRENRAIDTILAHGIDGVILGSEYTEDSASKRLQESDVKYVMINRVSNGEDVSYIRTDDVAGMKRMVNYLIELGHRKIAFFSGPLHSDTAIRRLSGFRRGLHDNGLEFESRFMKETNYTIETGEEACRHLLEELGNEELPTAICCGNDLIAIGVIGELKRNGIRVPEDISVTGYNGTWLAHIMSPKITSMNSEMNRMGRDAFKLLIKLIDDKANVEKIEFVPELVIGESTAEIK